LGARLWCTKTFDYIVLMYRIIKMALRNKTFSIHSISAPNKFFLAALSAVLLFGVISSVHAATPSLNLSYTGNGDNVLVTVTGDANSGVNLSYLPNNGSYATQSAIGTTNSNGNFSAVLSTSNYNISSINNLVYVTVNNQNSAPLPWPYSNGTINNGSAISLSQTSLTLSVGQSTVITATNSGSNSLYMSSNTNSSVVNISLNANQITVTANVAGSTSVTVCAVGNSSNCASFTVTVQGAVQSLLFSQNNLLITVGQTVPVTVAGGTGTYMISNNSNPTVIQASVNGSNVNFYATVSSGSAAVTVCSIDNSACGIINATASGVAGSSAISFSQTNPIIVVGQTVSVSVSGGSGNYYVSSNSSPTIVQTNIVGSTLTLFGNSTGSATINICSASGGCGMLVAVVNTSGISGSLTLSQSSITLSSGQSSSITISGGSTPYNLLSSANSSVYQASISGNVLSVTGLGSGSATLNVCSSGNSQCGVLYVTVNGSGTVPVTSSGPMILNQMLSVGQSANIYISGGSSPYYLSSNPGNIFGAVLNGSTLTLSGVSAGSSSINVCSSNAVCTPVYVTVGGSSSISTPASSQTAASIAAQIQALQNQITQVQAGGTATASSFKFLSPLKLGDKNADVTQLQQRLTAEGVYSGPINGSFGPLTEAAVKAYQTKHGLTPLGSVGPGTRAALNGQ